MSHRGADLLRRILAGIVDAPNCDSRRKHSMYRKSPTMFALYRFEI